MASLVAPLASGIVGAASGAAVFYQLGTGTLATVYSDSEGVTPVTTHTLDANGGIVRYVEARVDVVVTDVTGATIRTFTWGTDARDARVENAGFTGTLVGGGTGAGGRTTVDAVLTAAFASFGSLDFEVSVNGTPRTVAEAVASSAGLMFNVKNSPYNAVGDGVADDSTAIQTAMNAAVNADGGIVYFPSGTYLIETGLSMPAGEGTVTYLGESSTGSILKQGTSGITLLSTGGDNSNLFLGLTFTATASNTGTLVSVGGGSRATFIGCAFEPLAGTHVYLVDDPATVVVFDSCTFSQAGLDSRVVLSPVVGTGPPAVFQGCSIVTAGESMTTLQGVAASLSCCRITLGSAIAAGTTIFSSLGLVRMMGCEVTNLFTSGSVALSSANLQLVACALLSDGMTANYLSQLARVLEVGCTNVGFTFGVAPAAGSYSATRNVTAYTTSGAATSYTPDILSYGVHEINSSGAAMAFNNPTLTEPAYGFPVTIIYKNTSGGAVTPTFGTRYSFAAGAPASVNNGNSAVYHFIPASVLVTSDLVCISTQTAGGVTL